MTFSIIVPIYKVKGYLPKCIQSVLDQTFSDWELLLIDDGSPDECPEICDHFEKTDNRIHAFHKSNGGLSSARNYGLQYASGEWIIFLDGDDWLDCQALFNFSVAISQDTDMLQGRIIYVPHKGNPWISGFQGPLIDADAPTQYANFLKNAKDTPCWSAWQWCYRRTLLESNSLMFKDGILSEDAQWLPRVVLCARKIKFVDYPFYNYRLGRAGSIMTQQSRKRVLDFSDTAAKWSEYLSTYTTNIEFQERLYEQMLRRAIYEMSTLNFFDNDNIKPIYRNVETCATQKIHIRKIGSKMVRTAVKMGGARSVHVILRAIRNIVFQDKI